MTSRYYADWHKFVLFSGEFGSKAVKDKVGGQNVEVRPTIFGTQIAPSLRWTPFCAKLFTLEKANSVLLDDIAHAPGSSLGFINELPGCTRARVETGTGIDLSPLRGNAKLVEVEVGYEAEKVKEFDLSSLPKLIRCSVPAVPQLMSFQDCRGLVSLSLVRGESKGVLSLERLDALEELFCGMVRGLKGVALSSKARLRALELKRMNEFEAITPRDAITKELLVVKLDKMKRMDLGWLAEAKKVECISLWTEVPSINFLRGLKKLHTLDLFGGKVLDRDFSFRDSLKNTPTAELWDRG